MRRLLNIFLLLTFQIGYLEWPPQHSMFVFEAAYEILSKTETLFSNLTHPIILLGLLAQLVLFMAAIVPKSNKKINAVGIVILGLLMLLFLLISLLSKNIKMFAAALPYLIISVYYFWNYKKIE
jgi:hypothetical protein